MIEIRSLRKTFDGQPVLRGLDLDIETRQMVAVVGPSGTGKSVLLKHIVGLLTPDGGDVRVDGVSVARASHRELKTLRRRMGYVFQDAALLDSLTIYENLRLALDDNTCDCDPGYCPRRIDAALGTVNLDRSVLDRRPGEVSGGMRKRVGVARALMSEPDYLLYDEPTTGLDPQNVAQITDVMTRAREACDATTIIVTHDLEMVVPVTDRVVLLADGRVWFDGTPRDFFASDDPSIRGFRGVRGLGAEAA
jgi:phospholipid/cholesterol/gamma-HCH transport system ATP-binding protein